MSEQPSISQRAQQHYVSGRQFRSQGRNELAEQCYRRAIALDDRYLDAWTSLGILLRSQQRLEEAEQCQRRAVMLNERSALGWTNLGSVLRDRGQLLEARECFHRAVNLDDNSVHAHNNLARMMMQAGEYLEALPHFMQARQLDPRFFEAAEGLGICLFGAGFFEDAIPALQAALQLRPDDVFLQLKLATTWLAADQLDLAQAEFQRLTVEGQQTAKALAGLAAVHVARGMHQRASELYAAALRQAPDDEWIRGHHAHLLLGMGDYEQGWRSYEYRWTAEQTRQVMNRGLPGPRWQGESLHDRTLLLIAEQGLGDEIMFASVLAEIAQQARQLIVECDARLLKTFQRMLPQVLFVPVQRKVKHWYRQLPERLSTLPHFDYWSAIGSLPLYHRQQAQDFPRHQGYLKADPERVAYWRSRLEALGPGLKIGLGWRGGTQYTNVSKRTLELPQLSPLLQQRGAHFISLQYGEVQSELDELHASTGFTVHHWPEAIDDYDETAALVMALDQLITVCTAIVHLGGALGRPVWVMTPFVAEWRYGVAGESMRWYPSVRLFRQPLPGDWTAVLNQLIVALQQQTSKLHHS